MKKNSRFVWIAVLVIVLTIQPALTFVSASSGPLDIEGTLKDVPYVIRVPADWNGTLLVYAHGYSGAPVVEPDAAFGGDLVETLLLNQGYALAASGFRGAGWTVGEGIKDTRRLVSFFRRRVERPDRVLIYGNSMGSVVVLKSLEKYPEYYDGAVSLCSSGAGSTRNWDMKLVQAVAYDAAFGWPAAWGAVGDVKDDINFDTEVSPIFFEEFGNSENFGLFEFVRLVSDLPIGGYYAPAGFLPPAVIVNTYLFTAGRAELEVKARGPVAQNVNHVYRLSDAETTYLQLLGVDVTGLLGMMNAHTNISAYPPARAFLKRTDFNGQIYDPVVMVHNIEDPMLPVEHTSAYVATLTDAGNEALLVRVYTDLVGHCNFTGEQLLTSMLALEGWLDTGTPPGDGDFPVTSGFVHGFEPGFWPQPPQE